MRKWILTPLAVLWSLPLREKQRQFCNCEPDCRLPAQQRSHLFVSVVL